jgi:N-methylhydantoinase A/oxoprolinase/acetone carboxylase beta subunit
MRIGIDVGGTNTDAVLMDGDAVLAEVKTATTEDVTSGILAALNSLVADSEVPPERIQAVMIGTTHFTNAFVEGKRLIPTAAVRLGLPATKSLPPMVDWPQWLVEAAGGKAYVCHGGHEFDGREIAPLDRDELLRVAEDIAASGLQSIAISAVFSPVNPDFEQRAAEILGAELPDLPISLSHELGRMGMLERENATIMNACLRGLATHIVAAFNSALDEFGIDAPIYLSQNDGTLMTVGFAERYPVSTFASGPTNSMRGAAFLSGEENCGVIDIGGTTADIGVLHQGFPREASVFVEVGGVRTNFRMPDVLSIGIGGGSLVTRAGADTTVGPESVGYQLTSRALVFGGDTLTASDLAVADGRAAFGDASAVAGLDPSEVRAGLAWAERTMADAVDRMKTSAAPLPVVLVGGGSVLLRDSLAGASKVIRPDHFGVANAIGAAIAQVGGEVEKVFSLDGMSRDDAVEQAKGEAIEKAVAAGAVESTVRVVDVEEVGLAYLPGNATRIKVKAIGDLELERVGNASDN